MKKLLLILTALIVSVCGMRAEVVTTFDNAGTPMTHAALLGLSGTEAHFGLMCINRNNDIYRKWFGFTSATSRVDELTTAQLFSLSGETDNYTITRVSDGNATPATGIRIQSRTTADTYEAYAADMSISLDNSADTHFNALSYGYSTGTGSWSCYVAYGPYYVANVTYQLNGVTQSTATHIVKANTTIDVVPDDYILVSSPIVTRDGQYTVEIARDENDNSSGAIWSGKADNTIQQASEGYFAIAGMAQNGVTTNFLYDNGGQVLAKDFVEDEQNMYWHAESVGNGMYTFKNVGTDKYLNIPSTNSRQITTSDNPQNLYFVISNSAACIHNGTHAIDVAYEGTSPVSWVGTVPEGSRRLLIYNAILSNPDATYTYTINILGAPNGTKVEFNGLQLASGDTFQAVGSSVTEDAFTIPTVHQCYDGVVTINGFNVTITYTAWPTYTVKVVNNAEGGVTYESQNYTNGQAIIAETFNEDLVGVIPVEGYASRVQIADNTITVYYMPVGAAFTDGEKIAIVGTREETAIVPGKWYVMTQLRGGETPIYDLGAGQTMKREAAANTVETLFPGTASEKTQYLLRFFETSVEGAYTIQFANGNYWNGVNTSANAADARYYYVHTATQTQAGAPSTKGWAIINTPDLEAYGSRVDNDVNGNMVYWESGNFSEGTNNVFYLYNVEVFSELNYTVHINNTAGTIEINGETYVDGDSFIVYTTINESDVQTAELVEYNVNIAIEGLDINVIYTPWPTYSVTIVGAPDDTKIGFNGNQYGNDDSFTAWIDDVTIDAIEAPTIGGFDTPVIRIIGNTIIVNYIYNTILNESGDIAQVFYWFDSDHEIRTAPNTTGSITIDASALSSTIHTIFYQLIDDKGQLSPVRYANFFRVPIGQNVNPAQIRYWFDTDGEVVLMDYQQAITLNTASLKMGLHTLYYQIVGIDGQLSPVRFAYFYRMPIEDNMLPEKVRYWFDRDGEVRLTDYQEILTLDASNLSSGIHTLYYQVADNKGELSPVRFANFYRLPAEGAEDLGLSGTPTLVRYWADTDHEHMQQTAYVAGHTIINLSMFGEGEPGEQHVLRYQVIDDKGNMSPVRYVGYIYDKHQQVIVLEEWEILKRFHDASVQQGEWTRNVWSMEDGPGETADESLEHLPGVSLVDGHVRSIDLSQSGVTGDVLSLAELPELEHLNLSGNAIANVELPLISETATANLRNQTIASKQDIVWDTPTEQSLTENLPNIMRLSADARSLAEQYTWTLWNAPTATGWRMSIVMKDAMPELRQVSNRIYDNANGGDVTLQVTAGVAAGTTIPVRFHYLDGDANLSGTVDVLDVQTVVNESFGIGSGLLNKQAADLQVDGTINVLDLVRVVNVLLAQEMPSLPADTRSMAKANTEQMGCVSLECINGNIRMESSERVCALDIWLCLPQGSTEDDVKNLLTGFDLATRQSGNLCHIVLYSPIGMEMDGMGEALLSIPQGTSLLRASAANAEANSLSVSIGQTTNITETSSTSEAGSVYDLQGRISSARGLHITKQHGIYTKSLTK